MTEGVGRRWVRWIVRLAAVFAIVAMALAIAVHTPAVRRYALRRAITALQETARISLQAEDLDYNLFALRATLRSVRISAERSPDQPFFVAQRVSVRIPRSAVYGPLTIDAIDVDGGRVRVARGADGQTNLPEAGDDEGGTPDPLRLESLTAPGLAFEFTDASNDIVFTLPAIDLTVKQEAGSIDLRERGRLARGKVSTVIRRLRAEVAFDGRTVTFSRLELGLDELTLTGDGAARLLVDEPGIDMRVRGRGDVSRLARWAEIEDAPRGDVELNAQITGPFAATRANVTLRSARLQWRDTVAANLTASLRVTGDRLHVDQADAQAFGGRLTAAGEVPFDAGTSQFTASWADVDIEALLRAMGTEVSPRPTGRATGTLQARGSGSAFDEWIIDATSKTGAGVTTRNRVALGGTIELHVERGRWRLRADERVGAVPMQAALDGRLDADRLGRSTVNGTVTLPPIATRAVLDLLRRIDVAEIRVPPTGGTIQAEARVTGTLASPRIAAAGTATLDDLAALAPDTPLGGAADVEFEATMREARVRAVLHDFHARVDATIDTRAPYNADVVIDAPSADLERLLRGVTTPVSLTGTVSATASGTVPLEDWQRGRLSIEVSELNALAGALPVRLAAPVELRYENGNVNVRSIEILAGATRVSVTGGLPVWSGLGDPSSPRSPADAASLVVTATGDLAQFTSAIAATGLTELPDVSGTGPAALLAQVTGSLEQPHIVADLELGPGTLRTGDLPPATGVQLRAHSDGEWIELRELIAEWQGSRVQASARVPVAWAGVHAGASTDRPNTDNRRGPRSGRPGTSGRPLPIGTVTARATSITPQVLAPFVEADTLAQINGSVDASVHLQSTSLELEDATGEVQLDRMDVRVSDLPIAQRVPTRIAIENGFARVAAWEWTGQGGTLGVQGRVRLADQQAALVATGRFDLRMLTPFVRDAGLTTAGALAPRISVTGLLTDPRIDGDVTMSAGEIRLGDPRVVATGVTARAVLTRTTAHVTQLAGLVNGGRLSGSGRIEFAPRTPLDARLSFDIDGMAIEFPEGLRSELNAALGVNIVIPATDVVTPSGTVTGTVTVLRSAYREPVAVVTGLLAALRTRQVAAAVTPEPSLIDNLTLDVRVITEDDVVVDNNLGRLELGTDVRVIGTIAAPSLAGRAQLREGGRLFLGRNIYVIESGTIDFANPDTIQPDLNIQARTSAGGEEIVLTLKGTLDNLQREVRSSTSPELGEADVIALLLTGRRLDEVSGREGQIVGEQVLGYLSGDVLGLASRAVGLDTIRLGGIDEEVLRRDPSAVATELDPTTRLTFGKSIGRSLDITYSQSLRQGDAQAWIVDYRPRRALEFRFVSDDEDLRSYELRHDVSIGAAAVTRADPTDGPLLQRNEVRVSGVSVRGTLVLPERRVRAALRLKEGDEFDFADWQRDRDRLEALYHGEGYYEARIDAQREESATSTALTYDITAGPRTAIAVSGLPLAGATLDRVRTAWSQSVVDEFLVDEARTIVAGDLAREGYLQARVEVSFRLKPEATASGSFRLQAEEKTLAIHVDPGPRINSHAVTLDVPDAALERDLRDWITARRLTESAAMQSAMVEREVTMYLRSRGYLRARVTVGVPIIEGTRADVRIEVEPGQVFRISNVGFAGATRLPLDMLREASGLGAGDPFDPAAVDRARERLVARYRREGFPQVRVEVRQVPSEETSAVAVTFGIEEGPRQVVTEIDVQGNRAIDEDVITRALKLPLNEPLAGDAWLQARRRVFDTGLFRRVDVAAEPVEPSAAAAETQPMRARVTVQEWPALRLRYGFQVAEERPEGEVEGRDLVPGLSADLTRRTLFGRAVTLGTAVDYQRREQSGRAFVSAPTMFGWPIESVMVVARAREKFTAETRVTDTSDAALEQRFRVLPSLRLSYAYRFTRDHTFDTGPPDPIFGRTDFTVRVARLNASAAYDTRDDATDTTRGMLLSSSFDYAPALLGSEFRFAKNLAQAYYFRPWRGVVFASAGRFGLAGALDDQELLPSERFRAGGSRTVRGAIEEGLGPTNFFGPTGGEAVVILNQEVRFPIYRWLRGVGFLDAGNVFETRSDITLGDLVGSAGFGLRLATPFALLRVDYGRLFSPGRDGKRGRWTFGIGQAF